MIGKFFGGMIGFSFGNIPGAILGVFIGHQIDKASAMRVQMSSPEIRERIEQCFFKTTFLLMGYIAKADGKVSKEEITQTEGLMTNMGLSADRRRDAIELFKQGSAEGFNPEGTLAEFRQQCGRQHNLVQMLIMYMVNLAFADGTFDANEERVLREVAGGLGVSRIAFEQLLRMIKAQNSFGGGGGYRSGGQTTGAHGGSLKQAYEALGVTDKNTKAEVKKAYRKLMSEYHPDKLAGQGVPEEMIKAATERSQEIQSAYEMIKKAQG